MSVTTAIILALQVLPELGLLLLERQPVNKTETTINRISFFKGRESKTL